MTEHSLQDDVSPSPVDPSDETLPSSGSATVTLEQRSVPIPTRGESRRITGKGKVGSQKTAKKLFNAAVAKKAKIAPRDDFPISTSTCSNIFDRIRDTLHLSLKVPRGRFTCTQLKKKGVVSLSKRALEKHFPVLQCAENQWAADGFIQQATQSDREEKHRQESRESNKIWGGIGKRAREGSRGIDTVVCEDEEDQILHLQPELSADQTENGRSDESREKAQGKTPRLGAGRNGKATATGKLRRGRSCKFAEG